MKRPEFPPNRVLIDGEIPCAICGSGRRDHKNRDHEFIYVGEGMMIETIAILLIVLWLLGMVSGFTLGNFIHVLLIIAVVLILVRVISGRSL